MIKQMIFLVAAATAVAAHGAHDHVQAFRAVARISDPQGRNDIQGNLTFTQLPTGETHVEGTILGLVHGRYGFHVHEKGDLTGGCLSAGGHYNPEMKNHGHPNDQDRHVGDLGNVEFDENRIGRVDIVDKQIAVVGPHSILGRSVVLHEREDDFGRTSHPDSRKTGNAGGRVACGVIGILEPLEGWKISGTSKSPLTTWILLPLSTLLFLMK